ncbi:MAG: type II toxin-antitoxin system prevent-host-death family antitoxin [Proteobacteria bacterium]|nr:type II toxin-antitoxin system prevent-host-death family antitoxin [Pseudomonadota bacterium]MBU4318833.1 type II toxin-antitoxin system prevent-host-death family antitoxin [Pseudomonadota bacterium]MBU4472001.1 type II toxin-antitoxin system prevent-host-death family antitoxin [Pseudomonadota bacterium]MCG2752999.1 type II toxin-antitoxin system prevent-host-death family antitoxin [Desulfobacteraceae bacterium]
MRTATVGEIQKNFGKILKEVHTGEEITILRRGKPVAKLTILGPKSNIDWPDFYAEALESKGKPASQLVAEGREERL